MIVFKTFLKVLNKIKAPIIMYTVFLIIFGGLNMTTSDNSTNFIASKPDILIVNEEEEKGLTKHLIEYIEKNSNRIEIKEEEEARKDALFYRDVNYVIYIPAHFNEDFLNHKNPEIKIQSTGDYQASLAERMLKEYLRIANIYNQEEITEEELIEKIEDTLDTQMEVELTTKLDTEELANTTFYYNFANYAILAGCVYAICMILSSFKEEKIRKRTIISSTDYKKYDYHLLIANGLFAITLWALYVILSFVLLGHTMFTTHGLLYILNSFVFTFCALTIAFLIGNVVNNKNAMNGIINVVALGTSFLCGAFVPMEWLPDFVLKTAHVLPSYWYIKNNELIKTMETINLETLKPYIVNLSILILFMVIFVLITNRVSRKKQKIG